MRRWLWFAPRTYRAVALDASKYRSIPFDAHPVLFPEWACQAPNGGVHVWASSRRIDIDVAASPGHDLQLSWTDPYGLCVIRRDWLSAIEDLIDPRRVFIGEVRRNGRRLEKWATLHEQAAPRLMSSDGTADMCPICGALRSVLHGRIYFAQPEVIGRPLIVSGASIFVREDIAVARNLRRPAGAFKPKPVSFNASAPKPRCDPKWSWSAAPPTLTERPKQRWSLFQRRR
jgi:hypothetical protein